MVKLTKDDLTLKFIKSQREMVKCVSNFKNSIDAINKNNVLHSKILTTNTQALQSMAKVNKAIMALIGTILFILITALVVLAGAEKALNYLQYFKLP